MHVSVVEDARRKLKWSRSTPAVWLAQAIQRIAWLYRLEADSKGLSCEQRLQMRQERSKPLWEELYAWLLLERTRVPEGSAIARAIDYSLYRWQALSQFLRDGTVPVDTCVITAPVELSSIDVPKCPRCPYPMCHR